MIRCQLENRIIVRWNDSREPIACGVRPTPVAGGLQRPRSELEAEGGEGNDHPQGGAEDHWPGTGAAQPGRSVDRPIAESATVIRKREVALSP